MPVVRLEVGTLCDHLELYITDGFPIAIHDSVTHDHSSNLYDQDRKIRPSNIPAKTVDQRQQFGVICFSL